MHEDSYPSIEMLHDGRVEAPASQYYKTGDVVFANHVIVKSWQDEYDQSIYIAAIHGELGVVAYVSDAQGGIMVNFHKGGEVLVQPEDINPYQGHVVRR